VIEEWCDAQGMPASLSQIARAEAQEDAKDPAPVVNISKKSGRAGNAKSRVTVPTFRQTVAWRCHNAAGEFASRQYIDRKESLEAVFHSIRSGRQTSVLVNFPHPEGQGLSLFFEAPSRAKTTLTMIIIISIPIADLSVISLSPAWGGREW